MAIVSPALGEPGKVAVMAPEVVSIKYPFPATNVTGLSESVFTDCQVTAGIEPDAPKLIDVPLTVILEFASLALAIEPASLADVIELSSISTAATEQSTSAFEPIFDIAIVLNLFLYIYNTSLLKFVSYYNDSFTAYSTCSRWWRRTTSTSTTSICSSIRSYITRI